MNYLKLNLLVTLFCMANISINAQPDSTFNIADPLANYGGCVASYSDCAIILFNGKMLVDKYTPEGICRLTAKMKGTLSVSNVDLTGKEFRVKDKLKFHVAIKNPKTNTLFLLTKTAIEDIKYEDILSQCQMGDQIIILTDNKKYSLTHNEIEIIWKC